MLPPGATVSIDCAGRSLDLHSPYSSTLITPENELTLVNCILPSPKWTAAAATLELETSTPYQSARRSRPASSSSGKSGARAPTNTSSVPSEQGAQDGSGGAIDSGMRRLRQAAGLVGDSDDGGSASTAAEPGRESGAMPLLLLINCTLQVPCQVRKDFSTVLADCSMPCADFRSTKALVRTAATYRHLFVGSTPFVAARNSNLSAGLA